VKTIRDAPISEHCTKHSTIAGSERKPVCFAVEPNPLAVDFPVDFAERPSKHDTKLEPDCFAIRIAEHRTITIAECAPNDFTVPFAERRTEHRAEYGAVAGSNHNPVCFAVHEPDQLAVSVAEHRTKHSTVAGPERKPVCFAVEPNRLAVDFAERPTKHDTKLEPDCFAIGIGPRLTAAITECAPNDFALQLTECTVSRTK